MITSLYSFHRFPEELPVSSGIDISQRKPSCPPPRVKCPELYIKVIGTHFRDSDESIKSLLIDLYKCSRALYL
jgi:hypothetical protein